MMNDPRHESTPEQTSDTTDSKQQFPWMDPALTPRERAETLVAAMNLEQKNRPVAWIDEHD
ncbi:MAG: hypothetical protein LRY35_01530 [Clostridiales bacterium]|nr:hypothetical protein [Clostridiales bacterium]